MAVLDQAPGLAEVTPTLIQELGWSLRRRFREHTAECLLEWWDRRVIRHLLTGQAPIEAEEVFFELGALRDEFSAADLPIDVTREQADQRELVEDERVFVRQLQLLAISSRPLELAIRDYKRAYMQRARWTDDALVSSRELRRSGCSTSGSTSQRLSGRGSATKTTTAFAPGATSTTESRSS